VAELQAKGYQYWALGHVHEHWIHRGDVTIAYPGNLQGRHIRELGTRGALLITSEDNEITEVERLAVDVLRWHVAEVDISEVGDLRGAVRAAGQALERALNATPAHFPLAVRVLFTGRSTAHAALASDEVQLRQEVVAQAVALDADRVWIEKVRVASEAVGVVHPSLSEEAQGALADLAGLSALAGDDQDFVQSLQADWMALLEKLPHEVLQASPELQSLRQAPLEQLQERLRQATPVLMGRVAQSAGSST
jgi:DNA repair exonuclease SbcCD nuclease subunit